MLTDNKMRSALHSVIFQSPTEKLSKIIEFEVFFQDKNSSYAMAKMPFSLMLKGIAFQNKNRKLESLLHESI